MDNLKTSAIEFVQAWMQGIIDSDVACVKRTNPQLKGADVYSYMQTWKVTIMKSYEFGIEPTLTFMRNSAEVSFDFPGGSSTGFTMIQVNNDWVIQEDASNSGMSTETVTMKVSDYNDLKNSYTINFSASGNAYFSICFNGNDYHALKNMTTGNEYSEDVSQVLQKGKNQIDLDIIPGNDPQGELTISFFLNSANQSKTIQQSIIAYENDTIENVTQTLSFVINVI